MICLLGLSHPSYSQDDIFDQIENELKKEKTKEIALEKADKNAEKFALKYKSTIAAGDAYFRDEKYDQALESYKEALIYKPDDAYAPKKVIETEEAILRKKEELKKLEIQRKYQALIEDGKTLSSEKKYVEAQKQFQEALAVIPGEAEAAQLLEQAKRDQAHLEEQMRLKEAQAKLDEEYDVAIKKAEVLLSSGSFKEARIAFGEASKLKPKEQFPRDKMDECSRKAEAEKAQLALEAKQREYKTKIDEADQLLKDEKFDEAIVVYDAANKIQPNETYPQTQVQEAMMLKKEKAKAEVEQRYNEFIVEGDDLLNKNEFAEAIKAYENASKLLPDHSTAAKKTNLAYAKKKEFEAKVLDDQYFSLIGEGDDFIKQEKYEEAELKYVAAEKLIPEKQEAKNKVHSLHELKKRLEEDGIEKLYNQHLVSGKELLEQESFDEAEAAFKKAHELKPKDATANNLILETHQKKKAKTERELKEREAQAAQQTFDQHKTAAEAKMTDRKWAEAVQAFHLALEVIPNDEEVLQRIQTAEENLKEEKAAKSEKEKKIAKHKAIESQYTALLSMAENHLSNQQFEEAILKFKEAGVLKSEDVRHREGIDNAHAKWEQFKLDSEAKKQEAENARQEKLAKQKANQELNVRTQQFEQLIDQAAVLQSKQEFVEALQSFDAALALFPDNEKAQRMRAAAKTEKKNAEDLAEKDQRKKEKEEQEALAQKQAQVELKSKQKVYDILVDAGNSEMKVGNIDSAVSKFRRATTVLPEIAEAKDLLAIAIERQAQQKVQDQKDDQEQKFKTLLKEAERG